MRVALLALLCCLAAGNPALAAPLVPADFAYGFQLPAAKEPGLYALDLPLVVYEKILHANLRDIQIFNGAGEIMPRAVRRITEEQTQTRQAVPFFPLPGIRHTSPAADLSLRVVRNNGGAIVTVDAGTAVPAAPHPASYLFDTTALDVRPTELELQWHSSASLLTVSLTQSSDLVHWTPLIDKAVLVDLNYNGGTVTVRRIALPGKTLPYIRLDCVDCADPMQLLAVTALAGTPPAAGQWRWLRLDPSGEDKGERTIEYRLAAKVPVTAVQIGFPAANSLLRARIESRPATADFWHQVAQADFYRLDLNGAVVVNPLVHFPSNTDPTWRIKVLTDDAGLNSATGMVHLELGWRPEQLVFLGRGSGPFTLAFGSSKTAMDTTVQDNSLVLEALKNTKADAHIRQVEPGPLLSLGGEQALRPRFIANSWKTILLWAVLSAGVLLLALMARTILREMRTKKKV